MAKPKKEKPPKAAKAGKGADAEPPVDGAGEGVDGDGAEAAPKKKLPVKLIAMAAAGAVVLVGAGAVGGLLMSGGGKAQAEAKKPPPKKKPAAKKDGDAKKDGPNPISQGPDGVVFYTMPDTVVNIQSPDGRPTYLKLKLAFETPDQDSAEAIGDNQMRLNDMFQGFLRELRPDDLSGSQGTYELRQEIQRRVNLVIAPAKVNAVLIQEMLVQ